MWDSRISRPPTRFRTIRIGKFDCMRALFIDKYAGFLGEMGLLTLNKQNFDPVVAGVKPGVP